MSFLLASSRLPRRYVVSAGLLTVAVLFSAAALGSLHTPILCAVAAVLAVASFVSWFSSSPLRARLPATILLSAGVCLTAFTALQASSLPASLVRALSPATADVWARALAPLHQPGPAWTSLSLDPTATRIQVLRGVTYIAAFLVALRIAELRSGSRFLSTIVIGTAVFLAMSALIHPLVGAERVFGIYKPVETFSERHIAPLLNSNHLAAYVNIGFCLALGMAFEKRADPYRPIPIAAAVLLGATQIWIASRGGIVAMIFGALCVVLAARVSRQFAPGGASVLLPVLLVAAGLVMIVLGLAPDAASEVQSADVSKIRVALSALPLALRSPFFGVGRGAFEVAFPSVRHDDFGYVSFTHPENLPVQWLTEWGIPMTVLGFGALAVGLRPKVLAMSKSPAIGAWSALATTFVQNFVDFNSEVPAIGIACAVCAAMVVAGRGTQRSGWIHRWGAHPRGVAALIVVASFASIVVALRGWPHELDTDRADLRAAMSRPFDDAFEARERQALLLHPSEAYVPFAGAIVAYRAHQNVIPWVERALELATIYGPAHLVLADQLARSRPAQARLEYRLAATQQRPLLAAAMTRAVPLVHSFEDALELVPSNGGRAEALDALAGSLGDRLPATSERLDEMVRALDRNALEPLARSIDDANADIKAGGAAPWCSDRAACLEPGLRAVTHLEALEPGRCEPFVARAGLQLANDGGAPVLHQLELEAQTSTNPVVCWRALGELALAENNDPYVTTAEEAVARSGCGADEECVANLGWAASIEERRGNLRRAIMYYERAQERAPARTDIAEHIATLASQTGLHAEALDAYRRLQKSTPNADRWRALADHEKTQMLNEVTP